MTPDEISLGAVVLMLASVFIASVSQVLLKKEALKEHSGKVSEYANPLVITAYGLFLLTTFLTMYSYRGIPLSLGPVLEATSYAYVTLFGVLCFGERVGRRKLLGIALIIAGIVVYGISCH